MRLDVRLLGLDRVKDRLSALSGAEFNRAVVGALNDEAYALRSEMQEHMRKTFDRVTPYIENSPRYEKATLERMEVLIWPKTNRVRDIDAQKILQAQEYGGRRADKRFEVALRRVGVLPTGYQAVLPRSPFPGSDDGYGNISGPFIQHLLAYFQARRVAEKNPNMTNDTIKKVHATGNHRRKKGMQGPLMGGRRYFVVAKGQKLKGVLRTTHKEIDLQPGIWADVSGRVVPVLLFTKTGYYKPLLNIGSLRKEQEQINNLGKRLRARIHSIYEKKFESAGL
jgi:hypothetical protein